MYLKWLSETQIICRLMLVILLVVTYNTLGVGYQCDACGTLKCENASICDNVAKCENISTLNVKIDAICEKITLNVKK